MMGVWSFLRQFMYTKFVVVVDDDVNIRQWEECNLGHYHAHGSHKRYGTHR